MRGSRSIPLPGPLPGRRPRGGSASGFTLLEVLVAVAILSVSLTSLLTSQMAALRATRYAQGVAAAAFLAEQQLIDIEWEMNRNNGWGQEDKEFEGDFGDDGWPDITYKCLVDMIEMPDYQALVKASQETDGEDGGAVGGFGSTNVQSTGQSTMKGLGMVWPMVKSAIEQSIRKSSCTVTWHDGKVEHEVTISTFWTNPKQLDNLPQAGGEVTDADDTSGGGGPGSSGQSGGGGAAPGGSRSGGGAAGGGGRGGMGGGIGGPIMPGGSR